MRIYHLIILSGLLLVACSALSTPIPTPTATSVPTLPPTPTLEPIVTTAADIEWTAYINDARGFSFEYPTVYDEPAYSCGPREDAGGGITVGNRIYISTQESMEVELDAIADNFVADVEQVERRVSTHVSGEEALTVDYRFGGTGRFGTVTFMKHADQLWSFNWTAGAFCDPGGKVFEGDAYSHLLETFQFTP